MSILRRRRVAGKYKRHQRNHAQNTNDKPRVIYNPYTKKLYVSRKKLEIARTPQFKLRGTTVTTSEWHGDVMDDLPSPNTTRFLLQNCNGLPTGRDTNIFKSFMTDIITKDVHFVAMPECNVNCINKELINGFKDGFASITNNGVFNATNTPIFEPDVRYQPGGVATCFFGQLTSRYIRQSKDKYGRWQIHEFQGKHANLKVYTVYRPNYSTDNTTGDTTAWAQQRLLLQQDGIQDNPRHRIMSDLLDDAKKSIGSGCSVILMVDLNEHICGSEKSNQKFNDIGMMNLMQTRMGDELPKTHKKGSSAIDHIYITPNILPFVKKAGFAPFDYGLRSDHRALMFDLDLSGLLDPAFNLITPYHCRRLKTTVPRRIIKYLETLEAQWEFHNIDDRYLRVAQQLREGDPNATKALNDLDEMITGLMRHAEKKCSKAGRHHTLPWSPDLHYGILHVRNCTWALKESLYLDPTKTSGQQLEDYRQAEVELKKAKEEYEVLKQNAEKNRKSFMQERVEYHQEKTNKTPQAILKSLLHIEEQQKNSAKIAFALEKNNKRGITHILIPARDEYPEEVRDQYRNIDIIWARIEAKNGKDIKNWEQINERGELEEILLAWQKQHFRQAGETPLASRDWKLKLVAEETQEEILTGKYDVEEELPPECRQILEFMKAEPTIRNKVNHTTSFEEFQYFIKRATEKSSCSPSGRNYSHYKTLLDEDRFLRIIHGIFDLALDHNIILDRWVQTVTTLMPKDEGPIYVHRLRAIHVVEAELQFFSKRLYAKQMVGLAEKKGLITDEQYGGRKGRRAQSVVLNKLMYYNITFQKREPAAFMDDDAKACYDRIIPSLASVEVQKWGISRKTSELTRAIVEQQQFRVKTAHGISNDTYAYSLSDQTYGMGQGLGWSGAIWMATSDTICKIIEREGAGMKYTSPDKTIVVTKNGDLFVDDTALGVTEGTVIDGRTVLDQLQKDEQKHAFLLFAAGHRLALQKCCYYLSGYKREGTKHRHALIHELPGELKLRETFGGELKTVKRLQPFQAHRTLGNYLAINGRQDAQLRFLRKQVKQWVQRIKLSSLSKSNRLLAYFGYLIPSLAYRLATSSLTYKQCKELQTMVDPVLLHSYGLQRNTPKIVLFSTADQAGLNISHMYHVQGQEKLKLFLMHIRRNDTTGNLLDICMAYTQLEIGISQSFLTQSFYHFNDFITPTWITHLWQYLTDCKALLEPTTTDHLYKVPRVNDFFLMDAVYASNISTEAKEIFNQIRTFLQLVTAADIVEVGSDSMILRNIYEIKNYRKSEWEWPNVLPFPSTWKETWQSVLTTVIQSKLTHRPLGNWIRKSHQNWPGKISNNGKLLCVHNSFYEFYQGTRRKKYLPTVYEGECTIRADILIENNEIFTISQADQIDRCMSTDYNDEHLPEWMQRNWGINIEGVRIQRIANSLQNKSLVAVADGSVKRKCAGQAWTLVDKESEETLVSGVAHVDGIGREMCSTRAEMFGIMASLSMIEYVANRYEIQNAEVEIYTDSTSSIAKAINRSPLSTKDIFLLDNDIAFELNERIKTSTVKVKLYHVKGHQDDDTDYNLLPLEARLNCDMDEKVGKFIDEHPVQNPTYPIFQSLKYIVKIRGEVTPNNIPKKLIESYNEDAWILHARKRLGINPDVVQKVDWLPLGRILKQPNLRGTYVKNLHHELNLMPRCKKWKTGISSKCPLCKKKKETWEHVLQCKSEHGTRTRKECLRNVRDILRKNHTHPSLQKLFISCIERWICKEPPQRLHLQNPDDIEAQLDHVFISQEKIGWNAFMQGLLSEEWGKLQHRHYTLQKMNGKFNQDRWTVKVVNGLLELNRKMWKNRCEVVQAVNTDTLDQRKRTLMLNLRNKLRRKPWKIRSENRYLLDKNDDFFAKGKIIALDMWEQMVFVAMEQVEQSQPSNDIRQYGTLTQSSNTHKVILRPTQLIPRYSQTKLTFHLSRKHSGPKRVIESNELQEHQEAIEKQLEDGQLRKKQQYQPVDRGKAYTQSRVNNFFVYNKNSLGHRYMARSPLPGATRKINNLNLI